MKQVRTKLWTIVAAGKHYVFRLLSFVALFMVVDHLLLMLWVFPISIKNNHNDATNFRQFDCTMPTLNNVVRQIKFQFKPTDRAGVVSLVFNLKKGLLSDDFSVLMLSAHPDIPSAWYNYREGRVVETIPLPEIIPGFRSARFNFEFEEGKLSIYQNDVLLKAIAVPPDIGFSALGFYPSHKMGMKYLRSGVLKKIKITTVEQTGTKVHQGWPIWILLWLRIGSFLGLFYLMLLSRSRVSKIILRSLAIIAWLIVIGFCGFVIFSWATFHCGDWREPYESEGLFDPQKFAHAQEITIKHRKLKIDRDPALINILVFGGSTTMGDPYDPETKYDYPAQLQEMLDRSPEFKDYRFQVINLGNLGATLSDMLLFAEPVIASTRPTVVVLHSVINNYYESFTPVMAAHILGFQNARVHVTRKDLEKYRTNLIKFISICQKYNAQPIFLEESFDKYFFEGENPLLRHQQVLRNVCWENGLPFIPLYKELNDDPNRLIFYEFVHMSAIGYRILADRIFIWMKANAQQVTQHTVSNGLAEYIAY